MTKLPKSRQDLIDVFADVASGFKRTESLVSNWESDLSGSLGALKAVIEKPMFDEKTLPKGHPLHKVVSEHTERLREQFVTWERDVHTYNAGTQFRERFGDSLMIFVYGKVKAGKSSLGNYFAYGEADPSDACVATANPQPKFFYETGNASCEGMTLQRMEERRRFGVGVLETTSSIQGFSLPGLTWVDSPGLHSLNGENGDLAKDYVESADLVLYLSNSASPGRRSDIEEITGLLKSQKHLLVLISGSDSIEEDEEDGKLISCLKMKSAKDRGDQEAYVNGEIQTLAQAHKKHLVAARIASVSVKYAEESTSPTRWSESGMEAFASCVAEVARSHGVQIKREAPLRNFGTFCSKYLDSIQVVRQGCDALAQHIEEQSKRANRDVGRIKFEIADEVARLIDQASEKHAMDDDQFVTACCTGGGRLATEGCARIVSAFGEILSLNILPKFDPVTDDLPGFSRETEQVSYRSSRNGKLTSAGLSAAGAGLGMAIGGPGGAAIGTLFGMAAGYFAERQFDEVKTISIDVGDNRDEVAAAARERFQMAVAAELDAMAAQMTLLCFSATQAWLKDVTQELTRLERAVLENQRKLRGVLNDGIA